nr:WRKY [Loropetalum chinense var. rubrum]
MFEIFSCCRKSPQEWRKQVKICTETGLEESLDDGCKWRKYAETEIFGSIFPRSYYRCIHKNNEGCMATKEIQRTDEDITAFEITYRGRHTCTQASQMNIPSAQNSERNENGDHHQKNQNQNQNQIQLEKLFGLRVPTAKDLYPNKPSFPLLSFHSTSVDKPDNFAPKKKEKREKRERDEPYNFDFVPLTAQNHHPANPREIPSASIISSSVGSTSQRAKLE